MQSPLVFKISVRYFTITGRFPSAQGHRQSRSPSNLRRLQRRPFLLFPSRYSVASIAFSCPGTSSFLGFAPVVMIISSSVSSARVVISQLYSTLIGRSFLLNPSYKFFIFFFEFVYAAAALNTLQSWSLFHK